VYDRLREDNTRIIGTGFTLAVVFTSPAGIETPAQCFFADIGMALDDNGFPIQGRKIVLTVNLVGPNGTTQFTPTNNPSVQSDGNPWRVSFAYNGVSFVGEVLTPMYDRTIGAITMNVGKIKVRT